MKKIKTRLLLLIIFLPLISTTLLAQQTRQKTLFNDGWKFHKGDITNADAKEFNDNDWRQLDLPHDWSIEAPFDDQWASATAYLPGGIAWYRKTFEISPAMRSKNIYIYFDGVENATPQRSILTWLVAIR